MTAEESEAAADQPLLEQTDYIHTPEDTIKAEQSDAEKMIKTLIAALDANPQLRAALKNRLLTDE
jgi:hypothetical protein